MQLALTKKGEKMEIKVKEIKKELEKLENLIDNYELTHLNMHNEVKNASFSWNDNYAKDFFEDVDKKKIDISKMIDEIKTTRNIYKYIVDKYETLGNNIKFNFENKLDIYTEIENCVKEMENIEKEYENLDLSFCSHLSSELNNQQNRIENSKEKLKTYKENLKQTITYIEETEKEVNLKISKTDIELIQEQKVEDFY